MGKIIVLVVLLAAAGAGYFAWQKMGEVDRLQADLANAKSGLDKARGDLRKAQQETTALSKEVTELKISTDQMRADRDAVRTAMETEQAAGERLRAELALAKSQVSYLSARAPASAVQGMPRAPKVPVSQPAAKGK